jgi:diaminopimelate epimerase
MLVSKLQGLGNDFVVVDLRGGEPGGEPSIQDAAVVRAVCDRNFGIGSDGVLPILPPRTPGAYATMRVLNTDGMEAEMCGNGIRCVVAHLVERDPKAPKDRMIIDTGAGPLSCAVHMADGAVTGVSVEMGRPRLTRAEIPMTGPPDEGCMDQPLPVRPTTPGRSSRQIVSDDLPGGGRELRTCAVSMGNPHAVHFVPETGADLMALARRLGPLVETHEWFPRKTNVEFAHVHAPDHIELVVWERSCGITLACGTGACATAVAACLRGLATPGVDIRVSLPGGDLTIRVAPDLSGVLMTGPARHVFDTDLDLPALMRSARAS